MPSVLLEGVLFFGTYLQLLGGISPDFVAPFNGGTWVIVMIQRQLISFHAIIPRARDKTPKSMCSHYVITNWVNVLWEKIQLSQSYSFIHFLAPLISTQSRQLYDLRLAKRPPTAAPSFSNALIGCRNHIFVKQLQHIVFYVYGEKKNAFSNI